MGEGGASGHRTGRHPRVGSTGARFRRAAPGDEPEAPDRSPEPLAAHPADVPALGEVGRTGARFGSRARRRREDPDSSSLPEAASPGAAAPAPGEVGRTGARFGSRARRRRREAEELPAVPVPPPPPPPRRAAAGEPEPDDAPTLPLFLFRAAPPESTRTTVRPYVRTRGRTRTRAELRVETLVSIPSPRPSLEDPEHRAIGELCDDPRSVAEVAALMSVPLGVARVLIDDMAGEGKLTVHPTLAPTASSSSGPSPLDIMQRILDGLHRL